MKQKRSLIRNDGFQSLLASLLCILVGLLIGYLVLLIIEPKGAFEAILAVMKNFFKYGKAAKRMQYFGQTIVKTMPLLMCALSVLFAYKVGMFNIGAAGQYVAGACASLFCAIYLHLPWYLCLLAAILAGAMLVHHLRVKGIRVVVVDLAAFFNRQLVVGPVIVIVAQNRHVVLKARDQILHQGRFSAAAAAGDPDYNNI